MRRTPLAAMMSLVLCAGCATGARSCPVHCHDVQRISVDSLPVAQREELRPDVTAVVDRPEPAPGSGPLHRLTELDAQCLAASNSTAANLLQREAELPESALTQNTCSVSLLRGIIRLTAVDRRNADAATALTALLRLAEAEGGTDNIARRVGELDGLLHEIELLKQRGLLPPISADELRGQRLQLLHRQWELQATRAQLNGQLAQGLGFADLQVQFWPDVDLTVSPELLDVDQAVALAWSQRADLAALRQVLCADVATVAEASRWLLQQASPALGRTASACGMLKCSLCASDRCEGMLRAGQIEQLLRHREQVAEQETRQAVANVELRLAQIALTRQRLEIATRQVAGAEKQRELVPGAVLSIRQQALKRLEIEQELLHDVIEYRMAQLRLKQSQGLLAAECGYCL